MKYAVLHYLMYTILNEELILNTDYHNPNTDYDDLTADKRHPNNGYESI
jgi:hypothetical protein